MSVVQPKQREYCTSCSNYNGSVDGIIGLLSKWKVMIAETHFHEITLKLDAGKTERLTGTGESCNGRIFFNNLFLEC